MEQERTLPFNIQFFAESGGDGGDGGNANGANGAEGAANGGANGAAQQQNNGQQQQNDSDAERIEKLVQSRVDRITAKLGKENAELTKQLDKMKKEKMTDEEIKQLEISEREKSIAEKEKALAEKENRLYAIKAIKTAGLDDGSDISLELVDFVMGDNEEAINSKVKSFKSLVDKMVAAQVDKTFKANGRNPNGGNNSDQGDDKNDNDSIAAKLGKMKAERDKKSNDILKFYTGGNK